MLPSLFDWGHRLLNDDHRTHLLAEWREDTPCLQRATANEDLAGAWINENHRLKGIAEDTCRECPVSAQCLSDALQEGGAEGLRGGFWFSGGALLSIDRKRLRREFPNLTNSIRLRQRGNRGGITNGGLAS